MLILTSPAKTLDLDQPYPDLPVREPAFLDQTARLHRLLKDMSVRQLEQTLNVSQALAELNEDRFQQWQKQHTTANSRPSLFTFNGDIFQQLQLNKYSKKDLEYADSSLIILSGFYGLLRPFDLMQPYRLEMHTKLNGKPLDKQWQRPVTDLLNKLVDQKNHQLVLNLASKEYSKAVDSSSLKVPLVSVDFLQVRRGERKIFALLAKRARGQMIDYCIRHHCKTVAAVSKFTVDGYQLTDASDTHLEFTLPE